MNVVECVIGGFLVGGGLLGNGQVFQFELYLLQEVDVNFEEVFKLFFCLGVSEFIFYCFNLVILFFFMRCKWLQFNCSIVLCVQDFKWSFFWFCWKVGYYLYFFFSISVLICFLVNSFFDVCLFFFFLVFLSIEFFLFVFSFCINLYGLYSRYINVIVKINSFEELRCICVLYYCSFVYLYRNVFGWNQKFNVLLERG